MIVVAGYSFFDSGDLELWGQRKRERSDVGTYMRVLFLKVILSSPRQSYNIGGILSSNHRIIVIIVDFHYTGSCNCTFVITNDDCKFLRCRW